MNQNMILYPAMAMLLLNLLVALLLLVRRIRAMRDGLNPGYFRFNRGAKLPDYLLSAEQHYQNLHEMPLVFFVLVVLVYLTAEVDSFMVTLAWAYVISRLVHSYIHLGSNKTRWRKNVFVASYGVLALMWVGLLVQMVFAAN